MDRKTAYITTAILAGATILAALLSALITRIDGAGPPNAGSGDQPTAGVERPGPTSIDSTCTRAAANDYLDILESPAAGRGDKRRALRCRLIMARQLVVQWTEDGAPQMASLTRKFPRDATAPADYDDSCISTWENTGCGTSFITSASGQQVSVQHSGTVSGLFNLQDDGTLSGDVMNLRDNSGPHAGTLVIN
ncbi:MAG: hypothetical protein AAFX44_13725 [Pseudomonadota bacterium]